MLVNELIEILESVIVRDSGRGAEVLAMASRGDLRQAAESIAHTKNPRIAIVTGFLVPSPAGEAPETDGPLGTAVLAAACRAIGANVSVITDEPCAGVVKAPWADSS